MEHTRGHDTFTGTAEEVIAELEERATGWHHMGGSQKKIDRALEAAQGVREGSFSVKVGNTLYNVTDAPQTAVPDQRGDRDENADNDVSQS